MRLGIMQPYFFPYLGHFALIESVDKWIVFDVTQYTPKTWMNRNRILHPNSGTMYVTVPLTNSSRSIKTFEALVKDIGTAKKSIMGKLVHYKKKAPYYYKVAKIVSDTFDEVKSDSLVELNISSLRTACAYLGIKFDYDVCTDLSLSFPNEMGPGDWAPHICEKLGATEYLNPAGGKDLFDVSTFKKIGVELFFLDFDKYIYDTSPYEFEPHLSILDVMMWNHPDDIVEGMKRMSHLIDAG